MAAISAHGGSLSVAGEPVELLGEPTMPVDGMANAFQVADLAKRRLDPAGEVVVIVDGFPANRGDYWVDYLFGVVTFVNNPPAFLATVLVLARSLPVTQVALVRSLSLSVSNDVVELQVFGDGYKRRAASLRDFSGEMTGLSLTLTDLDPSTAGVVALDSALTSGAPLLVEFGLGRTEVFRAWVTVPELSHNLTPGALYESTVKFAGRAFQAANGEVVAWGYGNP